MWRSVLGRVFRKPTYVILGGAVFVLGVSVILLLPHYALLLKVLPSNAVTMIDKLHLVISLYGSLTTNFTVFGTVATVILLLLFSINVCVFVFYLRRAKQAVPSTTRHQTVGILGIVSGLFGIGCAACGSIILTALLSSVGGGAFLLLLPLHGGEMALLGIVLLLWSINLLVQKITDPRVCAISR